MRSVKELKDIIRDSSLTVLEDDDEYFSSDEGRVKVYAHGNNACNTDNAVDGHILCTQPQDFISLLGATFPLRDWPGVGIKNILLPYIDRNEPPSLRDRRWPVFHSCFESRVFHIVYCTPDLEVVKGSLEEIFTCTNTTMMTDCLQRASGAVKVFRIWCYTGERFVHFAQFWLLETPSHCQVNWLQSERGILKDKLSCSFACGLDAGKRWPWNLNGIFSSKLCDDPTHHLKTSRPFVFVDLVTLEHILEYKTLSSDLKCSTCNTVDTPNKGFCACCSVARYT